MQIRRVFAVLGSLLGILVLAGSLAAQTPDQDLKEEIDALQAGQKEILKELKEIKQLLRKRQPPQARSRPQVRDVEFDLSGVPIKGDNTAKLTLVEFTDYQ